MYKVILFIVPDVGSDEGAEMSATYHSVFCIIKMHGRSTWEYLGSLLLKYLTVAGIFLVCDLIKSD